MSSLIFQESALETERRNDCRKDGANELEALGPILEELRNKYPVQLGRMVKFLSLSISRNDTKKILPYWQRSFLLAYNFLGKTTPCDSFWKLPAFMCPCP